MIPDRYYVPMARDLFSDQQRIDYWREITDCYAWAAMGEIHDIDRVEELMKFLSEFTTPSIFSVSTKEGVNGHEVVSFLDLYTQEMPDHLRRFIHLGLTSSDLTEYATMRATTAHAQSIFNGLADLARILPRQHTFRAGRTHGQIAEVTDVNHQMNVYRHQIDRLLADLERLQPVIKSPGPTGTGRIAGSRAVNAASWLAAEVVPSTQILPRDYLLTWATIYLRVSCLLESLATWVRLGSRSEINEMAEGAQRIGSSSMPHKHNPIASEKVTGMARVVRGYVLAISESCALWEDRDLSNSSTERIVVPDLAATVEHMLWVMIEVMSNLEIDRDRMGHGARRVEAATSILQAVTQEHLAIGPIEASTKIRRGLQILTPRKYMSLEFLRRFAQWMGEPADSAWVSKVQAALPYKMED